MAALLGHSRLDAVRIYSQPDEIAQERAAARLEDAGKWFVLGDPRTGAPASCRARRNQRAYPPIDLCIDGLAMTNRV